MASVTNLYERLSDKKFEALYLRALDDALEKPDYVGVPTELRREAERRGTSSGKSDDPVTRFYVHDAQLEVLLRRLWPSITRSRREVKANG